MSERARRLAALAAVGVSLALAAPATAQSWRTVSSARQVWDQAPVDVQIRYGAGELHVLPAEEPLLYEMEMRYDERYFTPLTEFDADRRTLELGLRSLERRRGINLEEGSRARFALTQQLPLDLALEFGAGEAELELGGLSLRRLAISTGASETTVRIDQPNPVESEEVSIEAGAAELEVYGLGNARTRRIRFQGGVGSTLLDFGGAWDRDAEASVQMGIGSVTLRFPRHLGVRMVRNSFLTSLDAPRMTKRGNSYYSDNWDSATHRLTVHVNAALGSIEVEWTGDR